MTHNQVNRIYDGEPPGGIAIRPNQTDEISALEDVNNSLEKSDKILKQTYFLYTSKEAAEFREKCMEIIKDDLLEIIYKDNVNVE